MLSLGSFRNNFTHLEMVGVVMLKKIKLKFINTVSILYVMINYNVNQYYLIYINKIVMNFICNYFEIFKIMDYRNIIKFSYLPTFPRK